MTMDLVSNKGGNGNKGIFVGQRRIPKHPNNSIMVNSVSVSKDKTKVLDIDAWLLIRVPDWILDSGPGMSVFLNRSMEMARMALIPSFILQGSVPPILVSVFILMLPRWDDAWVPGDRFLDAHLFKSLGLSCISMQKGMGQVLPLFRDDCIFIIISGCIGSRCSFFF